MPPCSQQNLSNLGWAFAKLGHMDEELMGAIAGVEPICPWLHAYPAAAPALLELRVAHGMPYCCALQACAPKP